MKAYIAILVVIALVSLSDELHAMETIKPQVIETVRYLSERIGQRSFCDLEKLAQAADYIEEKLRSYGCHTTRQAFIYKGNTYHNIIREVKGTFPVQTGIL